MFFFSDQLRQNKLWGHVKRLAVEPHSKIYAITILDKFRDFYFYKLPDGPVHNLVGGLQ